MKNFTLAVVSGKGGTGKTLMAVNLFVAARKLYDGRVVLADCDVEEPNDQLFLKGNPVTVRQVSRRLPVINKNDCRFCGDCVKVCAFNALLFVRNIPYISVLEDNCHSCGACSWACNHNGVIREKEVPLGEVSTIGFQDGSKLIEGRLLAGQALAVPVIREVARVSGNDGFRILDAPPGTSCPVVESVSGADFVLVVTEPTPFGRADMKGVTEMLKKLNKPFGIVINKEGIGFENYSQQLEDEGYTILGSIPYDCKLAKANYSGKLIYTEFDWFTDKIDLILENILQKGGVS